MTDASLLVHRIRIEAVNPWKQLCTTQKPPCSTWPSQSPHACWWCCHPFNHVPAFLPIEALRINGRIDSFTFVGNFCSWNCVSCYAENSRRRACAGHEFIGLLSFLTGPHRNRVCQQPHLHGMGLCECLTQYEGLKRPPPREALRYFGGAMTIDQYREGFACIEEYPWVSSHFLSEVQATQNQIQTMRNDRTRSWSFKYVYFPAPPSFVVEYVDVLPLTNKTYRQDGTRVLTSNDPPILHDSTTTTTRPRRAARVPSRAASREPRPAAAAAATNSSATTATTTPTSLTVNEEQAFYTNNLRRFGNLLDSMGITVSRLPK